jgi:thiol-disulfide isomerase/thioredoxin
MKRTFTLIFLFFFSQMNAIELASNLRIDASFLPFSTQPCEGFKPSQGFCISKDTTPPILTFEQFKPLISTQSDTVFILNFWATWCAPCVAELPYFEKLNAELKDKKVKIILVSLDFKKQIATQLVPFLKKNKPQSEVLVLSEKDPNSWIPKVSEEWSGTIPATLIFDKNKRVLYEQSFEQYSDLKKVLAPFINLNN